MDHHRGARAADGARDSRIRNPAGRERRMIFDRATASGARPAAWAAWSLLGVVGVAVFAILRATGLEDGPRLACAFHELTHVSCPTCGLTRAVLHLTRGELGASLALHPMAAPLMAELVMAWVWVGLWLAGRVRQRPDRWVPHVLGADAIALGAIWAVRLVTGTLPGS